MDLESSRPSTAITSRMYFGFASTEYSRAVRSITQPKKKILSLSFSIRPTILIKTCFDKSSTKFKTSILGPNNKPSSTCMKMFVFVSSFRKHLGSVNSGASSDFP